MPTDRLTGNTYFKVSDCGDRFPVISYGKSLDVPNAELLFFVNMRYRAGKRVDNLNS